MLFFCKTTTWDYQEDYPTVKTKIKILSLELRPEFVVRVVAPSMAYAEMVVHLAPPPSPLPKVNFFYANAEEEEMRKFSVFRIRSWNGNTVILFDGT